MSALPPCVDGSELARTFFTFAALVGAAMCSAFQCGTQAAGHNALRGSGPNRKHAFKDALTHTGPPDPRIDLVCITSSCPRQFLQSFSSQVGSGFTSLVALAFNATTIARRYCRAGAVHSIKSRHLHCNRPCPLYPRKRTCAVQLGMSALGQ